MATFFSSLTRISDLAQRPFQVESLARKHWALGDFVVGTVRPANANPAQLELGTGRIVEVLSGDEILGALGVRYATLEIVGDWRRVPHTGSMDLLSSAGLFGRVTSSTALVPIPTRLKYRGHVVRDGQKCTLPGCVTWSATRAPLRCPVVLLIGTSMSAGKTAAAKVVIRTLCHMGYQVAAAKLTGTGRYRDTLAMRDAGAHFVCDFVDVGLGSTICSTDVFQRALTELLSRVATAAPDVLVAEVGASPLEPYNGDLAVSALNSQVCCCILCASDPFAALGVMRAFDRHVDLISGVATGNEAGIALAERLTETPAVNLLTMQARPILEKLLRKKLPRPTGT